MNGEELAMEHQFSPLDIISSTKVHIKVVVAKASALYRYLINSTLPMNNIPCNIHTQCSSRLPAEITPTSRSVSSRQTIILFNPFTHFFPPLLLDPEEPEEP